MQISNFNKIFCKGVIQVKTIKANSSDTNYLLMSYSTFLNFLKIENESKALIWLKQRNSHDLATIFEGNLKDL